MKSRPASARLKQIFQCIGLSSLVLLVNYVDLLDLGQNARFHSPVSLAGVCAAMLLAIVALGVALFVVRVVIECTPLYEWARLLLIMFAPPFLIERVRPLMSFPVPGGVIVLLGAVWAAVLLLFVLRFPKAYRLTVRVGDAVGIFAGVFCVFSMMQIVAVMTWRPGKQEIRAAWETGEQPVRVHPRVVWIVFDELSYGQVFGHRAQDESLPNFDRLRGESTVYANVQSIGNRTAAVIPSLLTGRVIDDVHFRFNDTLLVHYAGMGASRPVDGHGTVFQDARQAGWRTAVVGWYNPYCTVYGDALDSCYWSFRDRVGMDMTQDDGVLRNAEKPFAEIPVQLYSPGLLDREYCDYDVARHLKSQMDLKARALSLLEKDQADFVFLHFPIPHSPNVWSRVNGQYVERCGSSYLDNLALADRTLGEVMAALEASPRWKDTTLVVQGDHGWRIPVWNWLASWTDEDAQAARMDVDGRPALLIHSAGQTQPRVDGDPVPVVVVHSVLEDVLRGGGGAAGR